ncbi:glycosyltransferase family 2 protein, partial [Candidatus Peregrinibacteria bacterium]|nr:glycosyltransferase family 2 protein [Candidatus Peregrinibacteria bacterium]
LAAYKNRRIADDGQGMRDCGQFEKERFIFGISGACPLYRKEALEDVKIMGEYLDDDFFMYKEDVDISWRFLLYGWKSLYYPKAIAYHGRGTGIYKRFTIGEIFKNRKNLSRFQKHYSFKNQLLMERKNELPAGFLIDFFPIMLKKIFRPFYVLLHEPYLFKAYFAYFKQLPQILKKRKIIMKNKRINAREMGKWFRSKSSYAP